MERIVIEQYIPKSALVAELERILKNINLNYVSAGSHPSDFDTNKRLQDGILKSFQNLLFFVDTLETENVDCKFYKTLGWRKCSDDMLNQKLNIRTTESGDRFLVVDGYEISINTLLKLPKED